MAKTYYCSICPFSAVNNLLFFRIYDVAGIITKDSQLGSKRVLGENVSYTIEITEKAIRGVIYERALHLSREKFVDVDINYALIRIEENARLQCLVDSEDTVFAEILRVLPKFLQIKADAVA